MLGRRAAESAVLLEAEAGTPRPILSERLAFLRRFQCLGTDCGKGETGRQHQTLLRRTNDNIDAPIVHQQLGRQPGSDGVHDQQRGMARRIDGAANRRHVRSDASRGLRVNHHHGLDRMIGIGA